MATLKGTYMIQNRSKYVGVGNPRYLSSWERVVFEFFDLNPNVIRWGSETVIIPYFSQADNKPRRYMVDLFVEYKDRNGDIIKELIEIKPYHQTQPPPRTRGKRAETLLRETYTFQVNCDKWVAAAEYARKRKMKFRIITERDIFK